VLALGAFDFGLEQSIVVPALPVLAEHYDASVIAIGWMVTGFLLASVVAVPVLGRLGDIYGKRRLLFVSLGAFAVGALLCALTDSIALAIAGRIIQGVGAAVGPLAYGLARDTVTPELLSRAIGTVVAGATAGGAVGFVISGLLVDHISVVAIFWFLFLLAVALIVAIAVVVDETPVRARVRVDLAGACILALGLVTAFLAISKGNAWGWSSPRIIGLIVVSLAVLAVFVLVERRVREPLVDLALVVTRPFAEANICACLFGYSFFFAVFLVPLIAASPEDTGFGLGLSTLEIGVMLLPTGLASAFGGWIGGRTVDRLGPRTLAVSGSVLAVGAYLLLSVGLSSWTVLLAGSAVLGLAWGFLLTGVYMVIIRNVSVDKTGVALAVNVIGRNTAAALGTQVAFAIIAGAGAAAESGYTRTFVMGAIGAGATLVAATFLPRRAAAHR
jgi:MFS family permease